MINRTQSILARLNFLKNLIRAHNITNSLGGMTDALSLPVPPHVTPISPASTSSSEVGAPPAPPRAPYASQGLICSVHCTALCRLWPLTTRTNEKSMLFPFLSVFAMCFTLARCQTLHKTDPVSGFNPPNKQTRWQLLSPFSVKETEAWGGCLAKKEKHF